MTIIDLKEQRQARRDAAFDEFLAAQGRQLAAIERAYEELMPIVEQYLAEEKLIPRGARCEAPRCTNRRTTLHAVQGRSPDVPAVLIPLCTNHLGAVEGGLRVIANEDDTLSWHFRPVGASPVDVRVPRRKGRGPARRQD